MIVNEGIHKLIWATSMQLSDRIGRRIKLQDLHVLMTVVQAGSMGKAARQLNAAQPSISKSIADLEHSLGVSLLDRHQHGVEPTAFGHALLDRCIAVFDELRQGIKNIEHLADPTMGEVRIGATGPLAEGFVSSVVDRLSRQYPRIVFHIESRDVDRLHRELHERTLDFLVVPKSPAATDERVNLEVLFSDVYVVAAGPQHWAARRRKISLAELVDESWAMPLPGAMAASVANQAFRASRVDLPRAAVFARPEVRMSLVTTGRFLSIFSEARLLFAPSPLKVLPVELPAAAVPNGIVTLKNRSLSPVAELFI